MKKAFAIFLSAVMTVSLAACGEDTNVTVPTSGSSASAESAAVETSGSSEVEYEINIATTGTSTQPPSLASQDFINYVQENSDGRFSIKILDSSVLGSDADILQQVIDGTLQISGVGSSTFSMYTDLLEVLSLPFLITNYDMEYEALKSDEYKAICDKVGEELGIKILFTSENGIRHFATIDTPIHQVSDMSGLKLRVPTSVILEEVISALGANPVSINYSELYSSLSNKIVDGEEVNYSTLAGQKHYEVTKYVTEVGMYCFPGLIIANLDFWNSLSEEDQALFNEASDLALKNTFEKYVVELDAKNKAECEENGMEITVLDDAALQEFKDATAYIVDEYAAKDELIAAYVDMARGLSK